MRTVVIVLEQPIFVNHKDEVFDIGNLLTESLIWSDNSKNNFIDQNDIAGHKKFLIACEEDFFTSKVVESYEGTDFSVVVGDTF
mgnify:FL=1